jgi:two-component system chemotaxis sensor kinase CheA
MAIDPQDDIVQDFLVESREILESVGEQLIALERRPDDRDLLNSIFRGFHTIKGGGGFLGLDELVEVCHTTEDIFNLLRQGDKTVSADLMDTVLQALDVVNGMFARLENGQELESASPELMAALQAHNVADGETAAPVQASATGSAEASGEDISDQEFEALLDALDGEAPAAAVGGGADPDHGGEVAGDDISDDEFERLLDDLHGQGQHGGVPAPTDEPAAAGDGQTGGADPDSGVIGDDEFEHLLDDLHGKGRGPGKAAEPAVDPAPARRPAAPAPAPASEPADTGGRSRGETSVRVDTAKLDDIMNLVGELVLVRNRLTTLRGELGDERLGQAVGNLELVTSDLQSAVMKTRMQPIKKVFGRFPRVIRDLARSLKKEVELTTRGEDTDLDKNLVEALADPLVHLVRNAVDHGLEGPQERARAGKPTTGHVTLSAEQEGDRILLCIADDGRGMDPDALRQKAVDKGVLDQETARRLDRNDCFNLIFMPGFSTKEEISDVSGRGVGMDVVKSRISQLNGTIDIDSELGVGTTIRIRVPLTLAILPTLMVRIQGRKFALPMSVVQEIFELERRRINTVDNRMTVMVRNKAMPLFFLERWLERIQAPVASAVASGNAAAEVVDDERQVVTVQLGHQTIGFVVDEVIGLEEVVIKPLGAMLHGLPGLAGSTITGDGRIALIIDIPSLIKQYGRNL